jgi:hypothetical protein
MKKIVAISMSFLFAILGSYAQEKIQNDSQTVKKEFELHFQLLDLLAKKSTTEEIRNCRQSVYFMESHTGIEATTDGNYAGRFSCNKQDLNKWHRWYRKKYGK